MLLIVSRVPGRSLHLWDNFFFSFSFFFFFPAKDNTVLLSLPILYLENPKASFLPWLAWLALWLHFVLRNSLPMQSYWQTKTYYASLGWAPAEGLGCSPVKPPDAVWHGGKVTSPQWSEINPRSSGIDGAAALSAGRIQSLSVSTYCQETWRNMDIKHMPLIYILQT